MFLNIFIRGVTIAIKFILMIFFSKFVGPEFTGSYSYYASIVSISVHLLGFDFYTYTTREIINIRDKQLSSLIISQAVFHLSVYVFVFFVSFLLKDFIGEIWFLLFIVILVEHFSQEVFRLLVSIKSLEESNILVFLKSGLWGLLLMPFIYFSNSKNIETVLLFWFVGAGIASIYGLFILRLKLPSIFKNVYINSYIIRSGIRQGGMYLVGSFCQRNINSFDKIILKMYVDDALIGVYSMYSAFANSVFTLVETSVINKFYPNLIDVYFRKDLKKVEELKTKFTSEIISMFLILSISIFVFVAFFFYYINLKLHLSNIYILVLLLISIFYYLRSTEKYYILYAMKKDRTIQKPYIISFLLFLVFATILGRYFGITGVSLAILIVYIYIYYHLKWKTTTAK